MGKESKELQFVSRDQAKLLKELGFDWDCENWVQQAENWAPEAVNCDIDEKQKYYFKPMFKRPSVALALKWIRDVKGVKSCVLANDYTVDEVGNFGKEYNYRIVVKHTGISDNSCYRYSLTSYKTYEEAESELLTNLLKILK